MPEHFKVTEDHVTTIDEHWNRFTQMDNSRMLTHEETKILRDLADGTTTLMDYTWLEFSVVTDQIGHYLFDVKQLNPEKDLTTDAMYNLYVQAAEQQWVVALWVDETINLSMDKNLQNEVKTRRDLQYGRIRELPEMQEINNDLWSLQNEVIWPVVPDWRNNPIEETKNTPVSSDITIEEESIEDIVIEDKEEMIIGESVSEEVDTVSDVEIDLYQIDGNADYDAKWNKIVSVESERKKVWKNKVDVSEINEVELDNQYTKYIDYMWMSYKSVLTMNEWFDDISYVYGLMKENPNLFISIWFEKCWPCIKTKMNHESASFDGITDIPMLYIDKDKTPNIYKSLRSYNLFNWDLDMWLFLPVNVWVKNTVQNGILVSEPFFANNSEIKDKDYENNNFKSENIA